MLNVEEALSLIAESVAVAPSHTLPLHSTLGCRLAASISSPEDSPPFDKSMMDGFAVRSSDLHEGKAELNLIGELTAGHTSSLTIGPGQTLQIMTGAPLPDGADAVVPVENSTLKQDGRVFLEVSRSVSPGLNIIRQASNMAVGEVVLNKGQQIRSQEVALLAEMGQAFLPVYPKPRVAILATGDELVPIDATPGPGQIRNSNALMLAQQVSESGAIPEILEIARDNRENLAAMIQQGLRADFLCLSGGVSAGKLDLVPSELQKANIKQVFHKVAMKPGKPIWFGKRECDEWPTCYVFGLPGNPVSSMVCFELFVRTALQKFSGVPNPSPHIFEATLSADFEQKGNREVWFPSSVEIHLQGLSVTPTNWKGSSDLRSTTLANCSACFPPGAKTYHKGETVRVLLWSGSELTSKLPENT